MPYIFFIRKATRSSEPFFMFYRAKTLKEQLFVYK